MDDPYYLYALTRAGAVPQAESDDVGPGIDPRYPVALIPYGRLAALVSRVGLDIFDVAKLQAGTADIQWLSQIAVRHHEIIAALGGARPSCPCDWACCSSPARRWSPSSRPMRPTPRSFSAASRTGRNGR